MRKIFALLILISLMPALVCCKEKDAPKVAVLWRDISESSALCEKFDKKMRFSGISYMHYDADGRETVLISQAKEAIKNGAPALIVNCEFVTTVFAVSSLAKEAGIPVIFMTSDTFTETLSFYSGAYSVATDAALLYESFGKAIADDVIKRYSEYDKNGDGKISYVAFGLSAEAVITVNTVLKQKGFPELLTVVHDPLADEAENIASIFGDYTGNGDIPAELIITQNDECIKDIIPILREHGLNNKSSKSNSVPIYTVGASDEKIIPQDKLAEDSTLYSVRDLINEGSITFAIIPDEAAMAKSTVKLLCNIMYGKNTFKGINNKMISSDQTVTIKYDIYD